MTIALILCLIAAPAGARDIGPLVTQFVSEDERDRARALDEFSRLSPADQKAAVDLLRRQLTSAWSVARVNAAEALAESQMPAKDVITDLTLMAKRDDAAQARISAWAALSKLAPSDTAVAVDMIAAAGDPEEGMMVRLAAAGALTRMDIRNSAAVVKHFFTAEAEIPVLIRQLGDPDDKRANSAHLSLYRIRRRAIPYLLATMISGNYKQRYKSAQIIKYFDLKSSFVLPYLLIALTDPTDDVRGEAVGALTNLGSAASGHALVWTLRDSSPRVRSVAAGGLGDLSRQGVRPARSIPALIAALTDKEGEVRVAAAVSLMRIDGAEVVSALIKARKKNPDPDFLKLTGTILSRIGTPNALDELKAPTP